MNRAAPLLVPPLVFPLSACFEPVALGVSDESDAATAAQTSGAGDSADAAGTMVEGVAGPSCARDNISAEPKPTGTTPGAPSAFHLLDAASPCYNARTRAGAPAKDLDGQDRPRAGAVDIGPDEL